MPKDITPPFPIEFISIPESNYLKGRNGAAPVAIVLHIGDGSKGAIVSTFKNPSVQKSSHFLVNKDGSVTQFVNTANTAYCNGNIDNPISSIILASINVNPNYYTLSIEHEGYGTQDITEAQYTTTVKLVKFLHDKWGIPLDRTHVIGHREIFSKKDCPGLMNVEKIVQRARLL